MKGDEDYAQVWSSFLSIIMSVDGNVANKAFPASLIQHLRDKLVSSIELSGYADVNTIADILLNQIVTNGVIAANNKKLLENGTNISKCLRVYPNLINSFKENSVTVESILSTYLTYVKENNQVFTDIKGHHDSLGTVDWNTVANNDVALAIYSTAAEQMGDRQWVQRGNDWMKQFTVQFYKEGGAKKHHMRVLREQYLAKHGSEMSNEESIALNNTLTRNLLSNDAGVINRKIRLLDVGSCYNPLAKQCGENSDEALLDVTALDLYPAHPSVFQCDFLNLNVGSESSEPITIPPSSEIDSDNFKSGSGQLDSSQMSKLVQLPAASYDVVTISLVLNYLPSPLHREIMIAKARQLLVSPNHNNYPHHKGLLLIVEKHSIFGKDKVERPDLWCAGKGALLKNFKQTICNLGFELVKYREMEPVNGKRSHLFAFATVDLPADRVHQCHQLSEKLKASGGIGDTTMRDESGNLLPRLWIKQDFDTALYGSDKTEESTGINTSVGRKRDRDSGDEVYQK